MPIDRTQTQYHDGSKTHEVKVGVYTGPAAYATGGEVPPVAPTLGGFFGLGRIDAVVFALLTNAAQSAFYLLFYNQSTGTIQVVNPTTGLEIAANTVLTGYSARFVAYGQA